MFKPDNYQIKLKVPFGIVYVRLLISRKSNRIHACCVLPLMTKPRHLFTFNAISLRNTDEILQESDGLGKFRLFACSSRHTKYTQLINMHATPVFYKSIAQYTQQSKRPSISAQYRHVYNVCWCAVYFLGWRCDLVYSTTNSFFTLRVYRKPICVNTLTSMAKIAVDDAHMRTIASQNVNVYIRLVLKHD